MLPQPLPLVLAPMAELSHRALRELIRSFGGCDTYYSEMISAAGLIAGGAFESYYLDNQPEPSRLVYQLCGSESETLSTAAAILDTRECAGIDINMGCSAPVIVRSGAGAAWLSDFDGTERMIAAVRKQTSKRLSVKLRIGSVDDFETLLSFCRMLQDEGVDALTLHPRTTKEKFKRKARWQYIQRLSAELAIPVTGNGDINSAKDALERSAAGGCAALMIGRLAVQQPWIFAQIKQNGILKAPFDLEEPLLNFLELLEKHQPPEFFLSRARRFLHYYCKNFKWGEYLRNKVCCLTTLNSIREELQRFFIENPEERFVRSSLI